MSEIDSFTARILATEAIADHTVAFRLERPSGFEFEAGQFLSVQIPGFTPTEEDDGERMLSIASAPHDEHLMVAMRMRDSAFKRHLSQSEPGVSTLIISPAMGDFVLQEDSRPVVFVAGGIGITPFYSMLRHLHQARENAPARRVTLLYGNRNPACVAWQRELNKLTTELPGFELVHVFSEGTAESHAANDHANVRSRDGFIDADCIRKEIADWRDSIFYVVGPTAMVASLQDSLDECGVPPEQVVAEFFAGY
ncbi:MULTISPECIES: ferredoxin--NADP reductase [Cupriavidus]